MLRDCLEDFLASAAMMAQTKGMIRDWALEQKLSKWVSVWARWSALLGPQARQRGELLRQAQTGACVKLHQQQPEGLGAAPGSPRFERRQVSLEWLKTQRGRFAARYHQRLESQRRGFPSRLVASHHAHQDL